MTVAAPDDVPRDLTFDAVFSNPPVRIGKDAMCELLDRWLRRLTPADAEFGPGGRAFLVIQRHLGADSVHRWLQREGFLTERLASSKGYRVLVVAGLIANLSELRPRRRPDTEPRQSPFRHGAGMKPLRSVDLKRLHRSWQRRTDQRLALLLDGVQDPFNIGGIVRTAASMRVEHLYLCAHTTLPTHPKVGKTSKGTERYLDWSVHELATDGVTAAREDGLRVVALELTEGAAPVFDVDARRRRLHRRRQREQRHEHFRARCVRCRRLPAAPRAGRVAQRCDGDGDRAVRGPTASMVKGGARLMTTRRVTVGSIVAMLAIALVAPIGPASAATKAHQRGTGIGTAAALDNPNCDPDTGMVAMPQTFVALCVRPFPDGGDNGGATARGVTATTIKVVGVVPNAEQEAAFRTRGQALPRDAATGGNGTWEQAFRDMAAPYERFFEQWGRTIEWDFYMSTGSDEAAQRADAIAIVDREPFAALVVPGGNELMTELATAKVLVLGPGTNTEAEEQSPYRWGAFATDTAAASVNTGEFVAKALAGRKAQWAGDEALHSKTRTFATIFPAPEPRLDFRIEYFDEAFRKYAKRGTRAATPVPYTNQTNLTAASAEYAAQAPQIVARLKEADVTTVILFSGTDLAREVVKIATTQEYFPEWVTTAYSLLDVNILARTVDQEQWAHAFGIGGQLPPVVKTSPEPNFGIFGWYWGQQQGTITPLLQGYMSFLFTGIQMAGPRLTAATYRAGMFAMPKTGGAAQGRVNSFDIAFGAAAGLPYDEYLVIGLDATLVWWSPDTALPANASGAIAFPGIGTYLYVNGAKRYESGSWPKTTPKFFDAASSTAALDPLPPADVPPDYPCDGCPSAT